MMKTEKDRKKIVEFFDLIENDKYDLRKYTKPILVYYIDQENRVKYSLWENSLLERYGLENVDGWDFEEDISFCPDWMTDTIELDEDDDDDDDE